MIRFLTAQVTGKKQWTDRLFSLRVRADIEPYEAGQFTRLGLDVDGKQITRPYSFVSAPGQQPLEFYFTLVKGGHLSPKLARLERGDSLLIAQRASGYLCLSQLSQSKYLWLLATGTGIGPFLSILATEGVWRRFEYVILAHGVRHENELSYKGKINHFLSEHTGQCRYIPFVTHSGITEFALQMRITQAIEEGQLEAHAGVALLPETSQIMACGHPNMVKETTAILTKRGFTPNKRRQPGNITVEKYW